MDVKHIVLTGGPCAGKSTALAHLYDHLQARGWKTILVPEAATLVIGSAGRHAGERDARFFLSAQRAILELQRDLPQRLAPLAFDAEKTVFIHDRAELDNRAYLEDEVFNRLILETHRKSAWDVALTYDAVIHMVTAADGAEQAYTAANNEARYETVEQAREADLRTQKAWLGHSHYVVVGNEGSFDDKLTRTLQAVLNALGEPEPIECERKWVLEATPDLTALNAVPVSIVQTYLQPHRGEEVRLRRREVNRSVSYYRTVKTPTARADTRIEYESIIGEETYRALIAYADPNLSPVTKTRYCFVQNGQHFELDHLTAPVNVWLMEAELITQDQSVELPEMLQLREVTQDRSYSNRAIAGHSLG